MLDRSGLDRAGVVAVGLKTYLGYSQTLEWLTAAGEISRRWTDRLEVVVLPVAPALPAAVAAGREYGFAVGAQDVSDRPAGAFTGELPASLLAELGVRFAEIGHAERRALFGETPELTMRKAVASVQQGLTPLLCVGEGRLGQRDQVPALDAAEQVAGQLDEMLAALPTEAPVLVAYEPVWAIGADRPAPVEHVRTVAHRLRVRLGAHPRARLIYGGTAGPGLFAQVGDCLDGLFLGRRAHDPAALGAVLAEVAAGVSAG